MTVRYGWVAALHNSTALVSASLLALAVSPAVAQQVWSGPGTDFNTGANWSGGTAPVSGDVATFQNNAAPSLSTSAAVTVSGLTFDAGAQSRAIVLGANMTTGNVTNSSGTGQSIAAGDQVLTLSGTTGTGVTYSNNFGGLIALTNGTAGGDSSYQIEGRLTVSSAASTVTLGSLSGNGIVSNFGGGTITTVIGTLGTSTTFAGAIENSVLGDLAVVKAGTGTLTLTGDSNSYGGGTTISAGTLQIGTTGGTTGSLGTGAVVNNASLVLARNQLGVANAISGTGSVTIAGSTSLTGVNSYSGGTVINSFLSVAADSAMGATSGGLTFNDGFLSTSASFTSSRAITISTGNASIEPSAGTTLTLTGLISGAGGLGMNGTGTLVLSSGNTYSGATVLSGGITVIAADGAFGAAGGQLFINGGTLQTTASITTARNIALQSSGSTITPDVGTVLTLTGAIDGQSLEMTGAGTLVLAGANTYTGTTTISSGTLRVGAGGTTGSLGTSAVVNNAALVFDRTGTLLVQGAISGAGTLTQFGTGTTVLAGNNTYSATTTITNGTLQIGNGGTTGTLGTGAVANNATLAFGRSDNITVTNLISGTGRVAQVGGGTVTLGTDNTYSGGTFFNAGTIAVSSNARLGATTGGLTFDGGALATTASFTSARAVTLNAGNGTFSPAASTALTLTGTVSGAGALVMGGAGTLALSAGNTYTGGTLLSSGVVSVAADSALGSASGALYVNGGALVTTSSFTMARGVVAVNGTGGFRPDLNTTLTLGGAVAELGTAGFTMSGAGTLVLAADNTYSGATTISSGTLRVGAGGATGTLGSGGVVNNASLVFDRTGTLTVQGVISGTGTVTQAGAGTTVLAGNNTYSGTTTISAGTLQLGNGGSSGTLGTANVVNDGVLAFDRGTVTVGNAISGTGGVRQVGTGSTTLTGALSHTGGTFVDQGSLILGASGSPVTLPGAATVAAGASLLVPYGSLGSGVVTNDGIIGVSGTSTAGSATIANNYNLAGGVSFGDTASAGTATITNLGNLAFADNSTAGSATISNTCCLAFSGSATAGAATITNNAAGNIDFQGSSSAGAASITNAGFVRFMDTSSGGTASYVGQAGSTVDFSYMTATGTTLGSLAGTGAVNLGGITLAVGGNGTSTTFAGAIADGGLIGGTGAALTKVGAGTLTLSGANTYTGTTTISAGTLRIGAGGTTGTLGTGPVANNATLAFDRSNTMTVSNAISGTGALQQAGSGTVILTGANTYSGTTTIGAGTLQVGAGGTTGRLGTGNVVNDGALAFNRSDAVTLANTMSGTGTLTQAGTGNLILSGASTYTGATFVTAGRLSVNGSIASSSGVTVASGGTLGGTGSLPGVSVLSGGTIAPGNSIGTLNVGGNLTLAPGSTTAIEVQGPLADRINVTGTAALGGTLRLLAQGGSYSFNAPYTLIQASAVTGNYTAVSNQGSFGAGVTSTVATTGTQAQLTLTPAPLVPIVTPPVVTPPVITPPVVTPPVVTPPVVTPPVEPPAVVRSAPVIGPRGTPNQISVAAAFDRAVGGGADVQAFFPLYNLSAAALPRGLDQVSGQIHAVAMGMHAQPAYQFLGAMLEPGRGAALGDGADGSPPRYAVWASGFGGGSRMGASGNPGSYAATASGGGVAVGTDVRLSAQVVAGMALAGSGATTRLSDSMGRAETSQIQGAIYGTGQFGALRLSAAVAYGGMDVATRRTVTFLGIGDLRGRYTSQGVSTRLEAGWRMEGIVPRVTLTPSLAFQGSWYETPSFTETGAAGQSAAALAVSGRNQGQSRMELSLRADTALTPTLSGFGRVGWAAYLQRDAGMTARFIGLANSGFTLGGARPDAHAALLSGGVDWRLSPAMTMTARVDAELASNSYAINGTARLRYEF